MQRILATAIRRDSNASASPRNSLGTVEMQIKLLQFVRPSDFDNFRHFVRWRDTVAAVSLQILTRAARTPAQSSDRSGSVCCFFKAAVKTMHADFDQGSQNACTKLLTGQVRLCTLLLYFGVQECKCRGIAPDAFSPGTK